jgi:hypothetical protein
VAGLGLELGSAAPLGGSACNGRVLRVRLLHSCQCCTCANPALV